MKVIYDILFFFSLWAVKLISVCLFFLPQKKNREGVLFLENFPIENAGYQYRAAKWAEIFSNHKIFVKIETIIKHKKRFEFYLRKKPLSVFLIISIWKRLWQCIQARDFKTVIVRRELLLFNDYGNLFLEKFLLKINPNVILDFDDDISASKREPRKITSWYGKLLLEDGNKFNNSMRLYKRFIVASNYLKEKVIEENPAIKPDDILIIPTCVDYNKYKPKVYDESKAVISFGWIGGVQNLHYLSRVIPALNKIAQDVKIELIVLSGKVFGADTLFPIVNLPWSLETEVDDLKKIDIGLMPLPLNEVTKGKGGFKLIQYMGLGIVSMASAITFNMEIVKDGINGFLVEPGVDWAPALKKVMSQKSNFSEIGHQARQTILKSYTFEANTQAYIEFVNRA